MKKSVSVWMVCSMLAAAPTWSAEQAQPLTDANPVEQATPSQQAVDMQTPDYESKHDVETMTHSNTAPPPEKPLPDAVITQDVMNRFNNVYQEKKKLYDQTQLQLTAAQDDLQECNQLSGAAKESCLKTANEYINTLTQKSSNLKFDMDQIKREMQAIHPGQ